MLNKENNVKKNKPYIVTNPQIEAMADIIASTEKIALDAHCGYPSPRMYATDLYRKGYGKVDDFLDEFIKRIKQYIDIEHSECPTAIIFSERDVIYIAEKVAGEMRNDLC